MIKLTILGLIGFFAVGLINDAKAIPSFPRDLKCETSSGKQIILSSNNSFLVCSREWAI